MPLRRVYCRRIREPPLTIERRREQLPKAAGRWHDRAPSAHLRVLFPRYRSLPRTRGPKPYQSPARRFAATVAMLANRADYWPALHPIPKEVPVSDRALPTMPTGRLVEFVVQPQGERLLSVRRGDLRRDGPQGAGRAARGRWRERNRSGNLGRCNFRRLIGSDHLTTRLRYEADLRHDG